MINLAGDHENTDDILRAELKAAGIPTLQEAEGKPQEYMADMLRKMSGEVKTSVKGVLYGWTFERAWTYWMCSGPGIELQAAEELHEKYGRVVRVAGHCGCPSPTEWYHGLAVGSYHVDSQDGLLALANTIKKLVDKIKTAKEYENRINAALSAVEYSNKDKWNERFIEELKQRELYITDTVQCGDRYPYNHSSIAPLSKIDHPLSWPEKSYIVWKLNT